MNVEPCGLVDGSPLPAMRLAPKGHQADIYWSGISIPPVQAGEALTARGRAWLVEQVNIWVSRPGGVHAAVRECNAAGHLHIRTTATATGYGVQVTSAGDPIPFRGVLTVTSTTDSDGRVATNADLLPVGTWRGSSGDLIVLTDESRWEQVGDLVDRSVGGLGGGVSEVPVVRLRMVRGGV